MTSLANLTNLSPLDSKTQTHLKNVYSTLCGLLAFSAAGVWVQMKLQFDVFFCSLAAIGFLLWVYNMDNDPAVEQKRLLLLGTFGFLKEGMESTLPKTLGPLIAQSLAFNPELVCVAFLGTAAVFACFSAAALCAKRRSYLFLVGFLSSATSLMCLLSFVNIFLRSSSIFTFQLYGGLLMFSGYVIYDTQMIVEKARGLARPDYIKDSLELFIDFAALFVRILVILMRNSERKERSRRRD